MSGKLYVGFDGTGTFKIGITQDHQKRLKQLRTANPTFLYLFVFEVENPMRVEAELHAKFSEDRTGGEWFGLNAWDLKWLYDEFIGADTHSLADWQELWDLIYLKKMAMNPEFREHIQQLGPIGTDGVK